jgi:hypothetical protein
MHGQQNIKLNRKIKSVTDVLNITLKMEATLSSETYKLANLQVGTTQQTVIGTKVSVKA